MRPPNSKWGHGPVLNPDWLRGPNEPTAYERAAKDLPSEALDIWVRRNYRSFYVPEAVLDRLGLTEKEF